MLSAQQVVGFRIASHRGLNRIRSPIAPRGLFSAAQCFGRRAQTSEADAQAFGHCAQGFGGAQLLVRSGRWVFALCGVRSISVRTVNHAIAHTRSRVLTTRAHWPARCDEAHRAANHGVAPKEDLVMRTIKTTQIQNIHRSTAENALQRAVQFLRTVGTDPVIRKELGKVGFTPDDLKQGWALIYKACSLPQAMPRFTPDAGPVADTNDKLVAWQSTMFLRANAALRRLHPEQDSFLFADAVADKSTTPVIAVSLFLERLDALENSPERKSLRKADHAALATLEKRGLTKEQRKLAKSLVHVIETTAAPEATTAPPPVDDRMAALMEVYAWVQDWSDSARAVITRRDHLIRLGLGKRRARVTAPINPTPAPSPTPPVVAQLTTRAIAALPPKPNGVIAGATILPADGGTHA
jgi:hypothetical protein